MHFNFSQKIRPSFISKELNLKNRVTKTGIIYMVEALMIILHQKTDMQSHNSLLRQSSLVLF